MRQSHNAPPVSGSFQFGIGGGLFGCVFNFEKLMDEIENNGFAGAWWQ